MDTFIIGAIIFLVVVAVAPFLLMRGQFGKPKRRSGGADGGTDVAVMATAGSGSGGKAKGHSSDIDANGDGGGDGGGGGE